MGVRLLILKTGHINVTLQAIKGNTLRYVADQKHHTI